MFRISKMQNDNPDRFTMSRKLISFDWAIKKILRSKANFGILEGFLSELLFTDITILEVLESESNQELENTLVRIHASL